MLCKDIRLSEDFNYGRMSQLTPGFVGADLNALVREAAMCAVNRIFAKLENEKHDAAKSLLPDPVAKENHVPCQQGSDIMSYTCMLCSLKHNFSLQIDSNIL